MTVCPGGIANIIPYTNDANASNYTFKWHKEGGSPFNETGSKMGYAGTASAYIPNNADGSGVDDNGIFGAEDGVYTLTCTEHT